MTLGLYAPLLAPQAPRPAPAATAGGSPATPASISPAKDKALHKAAQAFEAMFLNEMFQQMNADAPVNPLFGGGQAEKMYRSMLFNQYAKQTSQRSGLGVASAIYREMLKMQEKAQGIATPGHLVSGKAA